MHTYKSTNRCFFATGVKLAAYRLTLNAWYDT